MLFDRDHKLFINWKAHPVKIQEGKPVPGTGA
jgi:hypothetical protein